MIWPPSNWQPIVWVWLLGALCFVGLLAKTWRRNVPGAAAFRGLALANVIYIGTAALELITPDSRRAYWIDGVMHLGISLIGPCLALLFVDVTGQNRWFTPLRRGLMIGICVAVGALRFADPWLGWMYRHDRTFMREGLVLHDFELGPAFIALQLSFVAGMALGLVLCWKTWREAGRLLRRHMLLLGLACMIPVIISTLYALGQSSWGWIDPTPGAVLATLAITSWAMFHDRLVGVAPVARNFLIEQLGDSVLVVDQARAVVDFNPAAQRLLDLDDRRSLGQPLILVVGRWPALAALCAGKQQTSAEIHPQPANDTCWNAVWYPLVEPKRQHHQGFMLVLSDITERKRTERQLHELLASRTEEWQRATTTALHAAEEEQTRIGRLLHDTLCQDLIGFRRTADAIAETSDTANSTRLKALGTDLADANRRARELAHLLEGPDLVHNSFEDALDATVQHLERTFGLTCEVTIDPTFPPFDREHGRHLLRIIREAIGNGARHGKARHVWVDLLASRDRLSVTIANDGAPPPPPEALTEGLGSRQMRMRAALLGGTISLRPGTDGGAALELLLPPPSSPSA
jgi:signal transduction histidine kinase